MNRRTVLTTTGCAASTPRLRGNLPASLTQPCPPLAPLDGKTGADVLRKLVEVGRAYNECAAGKQALIDALQ